MTKKKLYFDNDTITDVLLKCKEAEDKTLLHQYTDQIVKLVKGIIYTHKIYVWWDDFDELVQEGVLAIYSAALRFNPEKGTAFNYLSIVVKQHLINWTRTRNRKKWAAPVEFDDNLYMSDDLIAVDEHIAFEEIFSSIDVPDDLAPVFDAISECISKGKVFSKRDISRYLVREGYDRSKVMKVFELLEGYYG